MDMQYYNRSYSYVGEFGDGVGFDGDILLLQFLFDLSHTLGDVLRLGR